MLINGSSNDVIFITDDSALENPLYQGDEVSMENSLYDDEDQK